MKLIRTVLLTAAGLMAVGGIGFTAFALSGIYDIAAIRPHLRITQFVLTTIQRQAVKNHARSLQVPDLDDPDLVKRGFTVFRQRCVTCHGAPGEPRSRIGIGVNPNPPPLEQSIQHWTAAEIAWITAFGLKMAGMPAFGLGKDPRDLWALTAFVKRLNTLSPDEYRDMLALERGEKPAGAIRWLPEDQGWGALAARGDKERGRRLIESYGCTACHYVPGIRAPRSDVAPPLADWGERHYIAGRLVNTPIHLVRWIRHPQQVEPGSAMPDLDVGEDDAWAIAGYLYSLGGRRDVRNRPKPPASVLPQGK